MPALVPVLLALAAAAVAIAWRTATDRATASATADTVERLQGGKAGECNALRAELATLRTKGGDADKIGRKEAALRQCLNEAEELGVTVDRFAELIETVNQERNRIAREWTHYTTTADTDPVQRNNTRGTILRTAQDVLGYLREGVELARTTAELDTLRKVALTIARESHARALCFETSGGGCSRFGWNEPDWDERATDEYNKVIVPIVGKTDVEHRGKIVMLPRWDLFGYTGASRLFNEKRERMNPGVSAAAQGNVIEALEAKRGEINARMFRFATSGGLFASGAIAPMLAQLNKDAK